MSCMLFEMLMTCLAACQQIGHAALQSWQVSFVAFHIDAKSLGLGAAGSGESSILEERLTAWSKAFD